LLPILLASLSRCRVAALTYSACRVGVGVYPCALELCSQWLRSITVFERSTQSIDESDVAHLASVGDAAAVCLTLLRVALELGSLDADAVRMTVASHADVRADSPVFRGGKYSFVATPTPPPDSVSQFRSAYIFEALGVADVVVDLLRFPFSQLREVVLTARAVGGGHVPDSVGDASLVAVSTMFRQGYALLHHLARESSTARVRLRTWVPLFLCHAGQGFQSTKLVHELVRGDGEASSHIQPSHIVAVVKRLCDAAVRYAVGCRGNAVACIGRLVTSL
jgi:hypothetical protein